MCPEHGVEAVADLKPGERHLGPFAPFQVPARIAVSLAGFGRKRPFGSCTERPPTAYSSTDVPELSLFQQGPEWGRSNPPSVLRSRDSCSAWRRDPPP